MHTVHLQKTKQRLWFLAAKRIPKRRSIQRRSGKADWHTIFDIEEGFKKEKNSSNFHHFSLGGLGVHRFMTGKAGTGVLWLLPGVLFRISRQLVFYGRR